MPDERTEMEDVGRYWDALVHGDVRPLPAIDRDLAATIERVQRLGERPSAGTSDRVWGEILARIDMPSQAERPALHLATNGKEPKRHQSTKEGPGPAETRRSPWLVANLATAALVALALVGIFYAFGPGRPARPERQALMPRIYFTPSPPELHLDQPEATWVWETEGGPDRPLGSSGFLALDSDSNLWVADDANLEFQIFAPDGRFLEAWRPPEIDRESATAHDGIAVAFDRGGNLYVVSGRDWRVRKYGADRTLLREWGGEGSGNGQFLSPWSIAVDNRGQVYVLDYRRSDVQKFDTEGNYLATLGGFGTAEGRFLLIDGGAVSVDASDNVWVSDAGNHRLQKFSPDGRLLASFGKYGLSEKDLNDPGQLAFDAAGRVFVTAPHAQHVSVFDADGTFLAAWGAKGDNPGEFFSTAGIVLDGKGFAYVSDGDDRVQKFQLKPPLVGSVSAAATPSHTTDGVTDIVWETNGGPNVPLYRPGDVAVDPKGNAWVVDGQRDAFQIFSPDGAFLESWGGPGSGPGEFAFWDPVVQVTCGAVAFDTVGNIYVADTFNHRIQKFSAERAFLASWGSGGSGRADLVSPVHVTVDANGLVYVVDSERSHIQVFNSDGTFVRTIGEGGVGEGQLYFPLGGATAIAPDGAIWVADTSNHRLQTFAPDGTFLAAYGGYGMSDGRFSSPNDIVIDGEGRVFVGDIDDAGVRIQMFSPTGDFLGGWSDAAGLSGGNSRLALDGDGTMCVCDNAGERVFKLTLRLPALPRAAAPVAPAVFVSEILEGDGAPLLEPVYINTDPAGRLWLADSRNSRFLVFEHDGSFLESWGEAGSENGKFAFGAGGLAYGDVAWDSAGNLYVVDTGNGRIQKFDAARRFVGAWGERGSEDGQFQEPLGIAIGGDDRVYVTDAKRDDVQVFDSSGRFLFQFGGFGVEPGQITDLRAGIAFAHNGDVLVADADGHRIHRFTADGTFLRSWGGFGGAIGKFADPDSITVDRQGRIYVTDNYNHRVQIFDDAGEVLGAWGGEGSDAGNFLWPSGIALDPQGGIYVADTANNRIQKFRLTSMLAN